MPENSKQKFKISSSWNKYRTYGNSFTQFIIVECLFLNSEKSCNIYFINHKHYYQSSNTYSINTSGMCVLSMYLNCGICSVALLWPEQVMINCWKVSDALALSILLSNDVRELLGNNHQAITLILDEVLWLNKGHVHGVLFIFAGLFNF